MRLSPRFPPPLFHNVRAFPLALHDEAQIRAWRTVKRFPKNASFIFEIVTRLHQLGLATSSEWCNDIDQQALSNLVFEAMHTAVRVQIDRPWTGALPAGNSGQEAATMFEVWAAGLPLFVWATVRHARTRMGYLWHRCNPDPIMSRVRELLESTGGYHAWPRGKSLEPVLATLFYCFEACGFESPWRLWCMDTLRRVVEILKLKTVEDLGKALEFFPSTEEYQAAADDLWREMTQGSVASI